MIVVADTGPLLALAKIGALDLLKRLYGQVLTAPAVYDEAVTSGLAQGATDAPLLQAAYTSARCFECKRQPMIRSRYLDCFIGVRLRASDWPLSRAPIYCW